MITLSITKGDSSTLRTIVHLSAGDTPAKLRDEKLLCCDTKNSQGVPSTIESSITCRDDEDFAIDKNRRRYRMRMQEMLSRLSR